MKQQLSYQNDPTLKRRFLAHVRAHRRADAIIQGSYGELVGKKWKGCAVACSLRSLDKIDRKLSKNRHSFGDHADLAKRLGIPLTLAYLEDRIFEGLPRAVALEWPARFAKALPVGRDLSGVWPKFALWLLTDEKHGVRRHAKTDRTRDAIDGVAALYRREIAGDKPSIEEWRAARSASAAASAASAAAVYAAYADAAAAYAAAAYAAAASAAYADAAYAAARKKWFRAAADKLVELLETVSP